MNKVTANLIKVACYGGMYLIYKDYRNKQHEIRYLKRELDMVKEQQSKKKYGFG